MRIVAGKCSTPPYRGAGGTGGCAGYRVSSSLMKAGAAYANGVASGPSAFGDFSWAKFGDVPRASTKLTTASTVGADRGVLIVAPRRASQSKSGPMLRP